MRPNGAGRLLGAAGAAALGVFAVLAFGRAKRAATEAGMALHGDWEGQLTAEHRAVKRLLKAMVETQIGEGAKRSGLVEDIGDLLTRHAVEEENVVYPALRKAGAGAEVQALTQEHAQMKSLLRELEEAGPEDPAWDDRAKGLKRLVERHIRKEEKAMFPLLAGAATDGANEKLTRLVRREGMKLTS